MAASSKKGNTMGGINPNNSGLAAYRLNQQFTKGLALSNACFLQAIAKIEDSVLIETEAGVADKTCLAEAIRNYASVLGEINALLDLIVANREIIVAEGGWKPEYYGDQSAKLKNLKNLTISLIKNLSAFASQDSFTLGLQEELFHDGSGASIRLDNVEFSRVVSEMWTNHIAVVEKTNIGPHHLRLACG